jgi:AcrR family transcriptional regulator
MYRMAYVYRMSKRDDMLDKALELFVAKGYDNVGVQAIVDAVGVQKPTLYHYFQSKAGLLQALLLRDYAPLAEQVRAAAIYEGDLPHTLERVARAYFRFAENSGPIYRFALASAYGPRDSELTQAFLPYFANQHTILAGIFQAAVHDHGNMKGRHHLHAITFLGSLNAMIISHYHTPKVGLGTHDAFTTCKHFMHGIFS